MKVGEKYKLQWHLHPVPNIHPKIYGKDTLFRIPSLTQKLPVKRNIYGDKISTSQPRDKVPGFQNFDFSHSPLNYSIKRLGGTVQYYNLVFDKQTSISTVLECLSINKEIQANLTYKGYNIPLPEFFR